MSSRRLPLPRRRARRAAARSARRARSSGSACRAASRSRSCTWRSRRRWSWSSWRSRPPSSARRRRRPTDSTTTSRIVHAPTGQTSADRDVDRLQHWLNDAPPEVDRRSSSAATGSCVRSSSATSASTRSASSRSSKARRSRSARRCSRSCCCSSSRSTCCSTCSGFGRAIDRRFPPRPGELPLLRSMEHALASYVRGQAALSLIIGVSAGIGIWILGAIGLLPHAQQYALLFGAWVALTEVIPYLGPWLGAIPPFIYALVVHPISALWVALLFLGIQQIEGHVVVPNVMGNALRLHPLLVIFGLRRRRRALRAARRADRAAAARGRPRDLGVLRRPDHARAVAGEAGSGRGGARRRRSAAYPSAMSSFPVTRLRRLRRTGAAARPRARDDGLARRPRDAAVRRARGAGQRAPARAAAAHRRVGRARGRGARPARRRRGDPVRDPGGEGRGGLGRVDRRRRSCSRRCARCGRGSPSCCCSPTSACASTRRTATAA